MNICGNSPASRNGAFFYAALVCILLLLIPAAAEMPELRLRLDSLEIEIQTRRRLGRPIGDLEKEKAALRDSLSELRASAPPAHVSSVSAARENAGNFSLPDVLANIQFPGFLQPLQPHNMFDWIIIGTGAIALLSGVFLLFGIILRRKHKKHKEPNQKPRKMNLAPTGPQPALDAGGLTPAAGLQIPAAADNPARRPLPDSAPPAGLQPLQSLMDKIRSAVPPPPAPEMPPEPKPVPAYTPAPEYKPAPVSVYIPDPEPEPAPLIVMNPPDIPTVLPEERPQAFKVNDLVRSAAKSGMSELEISKRYQISVDQVKLILRMSSN